LIWVHLLTVMDLKMIKKENKNNKYVIYYENKNTSRISLYLFQTLHIILYIIYKWNEKKIKKKKNKIK